MREYTDFRVELFALRDDTWAVHASGPSGETRSTTTVEMDRTRLDDLVALLDAGTINGGECFELGTLLGGLLLPGEVLELFHTVFPAPGNVGHGIRLRLTVRDPWAASLPWEYVRVPLPSDDSSAAGAYLALHPAVSFARHEAIPSPRPTLRISRKRPLRLVFASARYLPGLAGLTAAENGVVPAATPPGTIIDRLPDPVTLQALENALEGPCDFFHFSGHALRRTRLDGSEQVGLAVSGENGEVRLLPAERLAALLKAAGVEVAVINACNPSTGLGSHRLALGTVLVEAAIPAVVVMQLPVEDEHAAVFTSVLTTALLSGASLDEAVADGRRAMCELGVLTDWGAPVLFCRAPDGLVLIPADPAAAENTGSHPLSHAKGQPVPDSAQLWETLRRLCAEWRPSDIRDERTEVLSVTTLRPAEVRPADAAVATLVSLLSKAYPAAVPEEELMARAGLTQRRQLTALVREADQLLTQRNDEELSRFSVNTHPGPPRGFRLARRPVSDLLDRSPAAHAKLDYHLRLAFGLYDVGRYSEAVAHLVDRLDSACGDRGLLTVPEFALLFYYLSKSLLKLNRYDELLAVLEGPYLKLSRSVLADLEVERLHVAGGRYRQLGEPAAAQTCFEAAVDMLLRMLGTVREPTVLNSLGDSYVLLAQVRLQQALAPSMSDLVRSAALRAAREAMRNGAEHFAELRNLTGRGNHYEGRLNGTMAFVTVTSSLVDHDSVDETMWTRAVVSARAGFTPERERKPFGIVAGKFALSSVLLAQTRWHCLAAAGSGEKAARSCLREARDLLASLRTEHLKPGRIFLGPRFETPKVELMARTVEELDKREKLDVFCWTEIAAREAIWSPLV